MAEGSPGNRALLENVLRSYGSQEPEKLDIGDIMIGIIEYEAAKVASRWKAHPTAKANEPFLRTKALIAVYLSVIARVRQDGGGDAHRLHGRRLS